MKKRTMFALLAALTLLIMDSRCAADSARDALSLCARSLTPSLFPLFVLSGVLVPGLAQIRIRGLSRLLGFPEGFFLLGCLGGYPMGAAAIAQAVEQGTLSKQDAQRMTGLCSICGPGFLFGVVGTLLSPRAAAVLFTIQLEAAFLTASFWPGRTACLCAPSPEPVSLPNAMSRAVSSILSVCGWVTMAAVAAGFLGRWLYPFLGSAASVVLTGLMELTNGIFAAGALTNEQQFVLCGVFCAFGGFSVLLQICGISGGIPMAQCIAQKSVHAFLTAAVSMLWLRWGAVSLLLLPAVLFTKIAVEIPGRMVYNVRRKEGI